MRPTRPGLLDAMRARGIRVTEQRRVLAELLETADEHLDADAVLRLARTRDASIHRATVYRTLKTWKKLGLVDELDLMHVSGERHYYEIRPRSFHIHLVCTRCKRVEEPGGEVWQQLRERVEEETGFLPEVVRLEMAGVCSSCRARA